MAAALVFRRGRVAVIKLRADAPRWAGMWQFPAVELQANEQARTAAERAARELAGLSVRVGDAMSSVKHSVTRYRITLDAFRCELDAATNGAPDQVEKLLWRRPTELPTIAMPAAHRRLAQVAARLPPLAARPLAPRAARSSG
jgi:A/G-specific adenine glycosylase